MAHFSRHFTLSEAQVFIPWVRSIFGKVHLILDSEEGKPANAKSAPRRRSGNGNGEHRDHPTDPHLEKPEDLVEGLSTGEKQTLLRGLVKAVLDEGIVIQDVRRGLIDFPAWKGTQEVLLCYELEDGPAIGYWHEVNAGYAGRQKLENWPQD